MTLALDLHLPHLLRVLHRHYIESSADFSEDGRYRWRLWRRWADGPALMIIALNPSTAGADADDATARRDVGFANGFGYGALTKLNLYAGRATNPRDLAAMDDPIGPENDAYLDREAARHDQIVFAWGGNADPARASRVAGRMWRICRRTGGGLAVLGWTAGNQPRHPLYLKATTPLQCLTARAHQEMVDVDPRWIGLLWNSAAFDDEAACADDLAKVSA